MPITREQARAGVNRRVVSIARGSDDLEFGIISSVPAHASYAYVIPDGDNVPKAIRFADLDFADG